MILEDRVRFGLPAELQQLVDDPDPVRRAVGRAIAGCVQDDQGSDERTWQLIIEELRDRLTASTDDVSVRLRSRRSSDQVAPVGEITRLRSKKLPWAQLLMNLVRQLRPDRVLELGTGVGLSAAYLAAGLRLNGSGALVTIDGAPGLAALSRDNLAQLGFHEVEVLDAMFQEALPGLLERLAPLDLVFVDGHHDEVATQRYFDQLLPALATRAVVVFDDISWSPGMERAWQRLRLHPAVRTVVDLERIGVCVLGPADEPAHLVELRSIPELRKQRVVPPADRPTPAVRLCWGEHPGPPPDGWIVVGDGPDGRGGIAADVPAGLPLRTGTVDTAVCPQSLPTLALDEIVPALAELRRVLRPGGVLRLCLPDLERLTKRWLTGQQHQFVVPDHQSSTPSGKFIVHALWYGRHRTLFTPEFAHELLLAAGFSDIRFCGRGATTGTDDDIVTFDDADPLRFFVEARS